MGFRSSRTLRRTGRTPIAAAVLIGMCAPAVQAQVQESWNPNALASRASVARTRGDDGAPIFVYEFANFQCTHCRKFALDVFPSIDSVFIKPGRVRWIFVHLPAPSHANAWAAHEAAACAGAVGDRFWAMHDRLFATQAEWSELGDARHVFEKMARELGIGFDAFEECVAADRVSALLLQDVMFAAASGVNGTPAFVVNNGFTVMGLKSFEEWKDILEKALREGERRR